MAKNGVFHFSGTAADPGTVAYISIPAKGRDMNIDLFLEDGTIVVQGNADSAESVIVSGTTGNDDERLFSLQELEVYQESIKRRRAYQDAEKRKDSVEMNRLTKEMNDAYDETRKRITSLRTQFVRTHPHSAASTTALYLAQDDLHWSKLEELYNSIDQKYHHNSYSETIEKKIVAGKRVDIGQTAPGFSAPDSSGKMISIKDFRGKYVLLDFWASWCVPCREEMKNVKNIYEKYKKKNFIVLGFSMDEHKDKWMKALVEDQLAWPNVADLKFFDSPIPQLYGVQPIPDNFLIDRDGKILGRRLFGDQLDQALYSLK